MTRQCQKINIYWPVTWVKALRPLPPPNGLFLRCMMWWQSSEQCGCLGSLALCTRTIACPSKLSECNSALMLKMTTKEKMLILIHLSCQRTCMALKRQCYYSSLFCGASCKQSRSQKHGYGQQSQLPRFYFNLVNILGPPTLNENKPSHLANVNSRIGKDATLHKVWWVGRE